LIFLGCKEDYLPSWYREIQYVKLNIPIERSEEIEKNDENVGSIREKKRHVFFFSFWISL